MGDVCGIRLSEGKLTIAPKPSKELGYAQARWDSPLGTIESKWHYEQDRVVFEVAIPTNVTADIRLPDGSAFHVQSRSHIFACAE